MYDVIQPLQETLISAWFNKTYETYAHIELI